MFIGLYVIWRSNFKFTHIKIVPDHCKGMIIVYKCETRLPFQQQKVCKLKITPPDHCKPMFIGLQ